WFSSGAQVPPRTSRSEQPLSPPFESIGALAEADFSPSPLLQPPRVAATPNAPSRPTLRRRFDTNVDLSNFIEMDMTSPSVRCPAGVEERNLVNRYFDDVRCGAAVSRNLRLMMAICLFRTRPK